MKIAIHNKSGNYWKAWIEGIKSKGAGCVAIDVRTNAGFIEASKCDGIMWHIDMTPSMQMAASSILNTLEFSARKNVFPNFNTRWHFDNKVSQSYLFKQMGVNTPETNVFWSESEALEWAATGCEFPIVAKLKRGASSSAVYILNSEKQLTEYINNMFSVKGISSSTGRVSRSSYRVWRDFARNSILHLPRPLLKHFLEKRPRLREVWGNERGYAYFQEYVPENEFDTRVTVIGNRAFAFRRWNRQGDFRASGSGKIDYDTSAINMEMVSIAHSIGQNCGFQSMAYDFLTDRNGKPSLIEISYAYQSKAVFDCPGHWNDKLEWQEGHVLPEAAHVEDFLKQIERNLS